MAGSTRAHRPAWLEKGRAFGFSLQLYELRSARNWGIGDFADLKTMVTIAGRAGADFVGINPQHAPFLADPARASPYRPSSRRFLNPLSIAPDRLPDFAPTPAEEQELRRLSGALRIDYPAVARLKIAALRRYWRGWKEAMRRGDATALPAGAYAEFCERKGASLRLHAVFEALSFAQVSEGRKAGWTDWPSALQSPRAPAVEAFAEREAETVQFHMFLQFLADIQLRAAADHAERCGLRLGLYLDLAVGDAPDGSETWSFPDLHLKGQRIGYPPDPISAEGQDWGLSAFDPDRLREEGAAPLGALLAHVGEHAGVLRIDHAAGLAELYLIPDGKSARQGKTVELPRQAMLQAAATASRETRTLLIAEDLGRMPTGFSRALAANRILSTRLLIESMRGGSDLPPKEFKRGALAMISTHDHPSLRQWLLGDDIRLREEAGLLPPRDAAPQRARRETQAAALLRAFRRQDLVDGLGLSGFGTATSKEMDQMVLAAHLYLARSPSMLVAIRLADLATDAEMTNLPGTETEYPNWQPRFPVSLEQLAGLPLFNAVTEALLEERPRSA